uniref:Syc1184_c n=1 Tax=Caligus rogercresseyi TaxID=217165 RepID=C1BNS2_CALRO|nr:syc1184_c [Caligus rogercresseyi]
MKSPLYRFLFFLFAVIICLPFKGNTLLSDKDLSEVHEHYMNYPYPYVDPSGENKYSIPPIKGPRIEDINHYFFEGRGDLGRNKIFRILIAGGGTGSGLIHYAYMFRNNKQAEITYLDFSLKSLEIARERARNYGFKGISFVQDSIYNIPKIELGSFDYIDCYGVLHHLSDPEEALRILKNVLSPHGGMFLMLYAYYGRQGTYSIQGSLRILNQKATNMSYEEEVKRSRVLYSNILPQSWAMTSENSIESATDVGFYDMYLHKQDVAFTIPELYDYIEKRGGLHIVDIMCPLLRNVLNEKHVFLRSHNRKIATQALNEVFSGSMGKHEILVSRNKNPIASLENPENVPFFCIHKVTPIINALSHGNIKNNKSIKIKMRIHYLTKPSFTVPVSKYTMDFIKLVLRRKHSIGEIIHRVSSSKLKKNATKGVEDKVSRDFKKTFGSFIRHGLVLLRHQTLSDIASFMEFDTVVEVN